MEIEIAGEILRGQVRWNRGSRCGIALRDALSIADLMEGRAVSIAFVTEREGAMASPGIFRAVAGDGPIVPRALQGLLLLAAIGSASFAISRLGPTVLEAKTARLAVAEPVNIALNRHGEGRSPPERGGGSQ